MDVVAAIGVVVDIGEARGSGSSGTRHGRIGSSCCYSGRNHDKNNVDHHTRNNNMITISRSGSRSSSIDGSTTPYSGNRGHYTKIGRCVCWGPLYYPSDSTKLSYGRAHCTIHMIICTLRIMLSIIPKT